MADSATHLPTISAGQASKEVTANALFDAMSNAGLFGRNALTTTGLTWGYLGGKYRKTDLTILTVANATLALTASATNYILETNGTVSKVTSAPASWPGPLAGGATALYEVVCGTSAVTSYTDYRAPAVPSAGTGSVTSVAASVPAFLSVAGSPITSSGTLAISYSGTALPVANGGSGATSHTAYAPLFGGTTSTGAVQSGTVGTAGQVLTSNGAAALPTMQSPPFDVYAFYPGVPTASAVVLYIPVVRDVVFADDFAGSYAKAKVAATGSTAFDVKANGSSVGTITFAAAATSATFVTAGGTVTVTAGQTIEIVAPGSADATLASIGFGLKGTR